MRSLYIVLWVACLLLDSFVFPCMAETGTRPHSSPAGRISPAKERQAALALMQQAARALPEWVEQSSKNEETYPHGLLRFLLKEDHSTEDPTPLDHATKILDRLAKMPARDSLGGGFHQASGRGIKRLSDNALLLKGYTRAHAYRGNIFYRKIAEEMTAFVIRDLRESRNLFWTAIGLPCDTPTCAWGIENGSFYFWTQEEIARALGPGKAHLFLQVYTLKPSGLLALEGSPFSGLSHLQQTLFVRRNRRVKPAPHRDIQPGLNGLMIGALATSGSLLKRGSDIESARRATEAILRHFPQETCLKRRFPNPRFSDTAFLEDYAYLAEGLLDLFETTQEATLLASVKSVVNHSITCFWDESQGGFKHSLPGKGVPLARGSSDLPSPAGVMTDVLFRLGNLTQTPRYTELAWRSLTEFQDARRGNWLVALPLSEAATWVSAAIEALE